jgi:rare lipoprotein A
MCVFAASAGSLLTGCAVKPMITAMATQEGLASYYSYEFQGRPTSSGEIFDTEKLTAAHRQYPFGTRVRVTNVRTQKNVEVKINDRGPMKPERVIDLTLAAAKEIGLVEKGVERVRVEVLEWGPPPKKKADKRRASR